MPTGLVAGVALVVTIFVGVATSRVIRRGRQQHSLNESSAGLTTKIHLIRRLYNAETFGPDEADKAREFGLYYVEQLRSYPVNQLTLFVLVGCSIVLITSDNQGKAAIWAGSLVTISATSAFLTKRIADRCEEGLRVNGWFPKRPES